MKVEAKTTESIWEVAGVKNKKIITVLAQSPWIGDVTEDSIYIIPQGYFDQPPQSAFLPSCDHNPL